MTILKTFLVATLLTLAAFAQNYNCTYTTFPVTGSGAAGPVGEGLNGSDIAVGWYQDTSNLTHGFRRLPNGTVKTFQVSGAQHTWLLDINDSGTAVGRASLPSGNGYGFKIEGGKFTVIRYPGATATGAIGINNNGDIVGDWSNVGQGGAFLLSNGQFTALQVPGFKYSVAEDVNDSGFVVGYYTDPNLHGNGFTYSQGQYTTLDEPGQTSTVLAGVNDAGAIVGYAFDDLGISTGFVYSGGVFRQVVIPNSTNVTANGINNLGDVSGTLTDFSGQHMGFVGTSCN